MNTECKDIYTCMRNSRNQGLQNPQASKMAEEITQRKKIFELKDSNFNSSAL